MNTPDWMLCPELNGLIAEIVADPRSTLFTRGRAAWTRSTGTESWSTTNAFRKTDAEAKLVEVFREETAFMLRRAFALLAPETGVGKRHFKRFPYPSDAEGPQERTELVKKCEGLAKLERVRELPPAVGELIGHIGGGTFDIESIVPALEIAARALLPDGTALIQRGVSEFIAAGGALRAESSFVEAANTTSVPILRSIAWTNAAEACCSLGEYDRALDHARRAVAAADANLQAPLQLLFCAAAARDEGALEHADRIIADRLAEDSDIVRITLGLRAARSADARQQPSPVLTKANRMCATSRLLLGVPA